MMVSRSRWWFRRSGHAALQSHGGCPGKHPALWRRSPASAAKGSHPLWSRPQVQAGIFAGDGQRAVDNVKVLWNVQNFVKVWDVLVEVGWNIHGSLVLSRIITVLKANASAKAADLLWWLQYSIGFLKNYEIMRGIHGICMPPANVCSIQNSDHIGQDGHRIDCFFVKTTNLLFLSGHLCGR